MIRPESNRDAVFERYYKNVRCITIMLRILCPTTNVKWLNTFVWVVGGRKAVKHPHRLPNRGMSRTGCEFQMKEEADSTHSQSIKLYEGTTGFEPATFTLEG